MDFIVVDEWSEWDHEQAMLMLKKIKEREDYFNIEDWESKQYKYAEESDLPVRENYKRRKEK